MSSLQTREIQRQPCVPLPAGPCAGASRRAILWGVTRIFALTGTAGNYTGRMMFASLPLLMLLPLAPLPAADAGGPATAAALQLHQQECVLERMEALLQPAHPALLAQRERVEIHQLHLQQLLQEGHTLDRAASAIAQHKAAASATGTGSGAANAQNSASATGLAGIAAAGGVADTTQVAAPVTHRGTSLRVSESCARI